MDIELIEQIIKIVAYACIAALSAFNIIRTGGLKALIKSLKGEIENKPTEVKNMQSTFAIEEVKITEQVLTVKMTKREAADIYDIIITSGKAANVPEFIAALEQIVRGV